jgi:hypothetical protein
MPIALISLLISINLNINYLNNIFIILIKIINKFNSSIKLKIILISYTINLQYILLIIIISHSNENYFLHSFYSFCFLKIHKSSKFKSHYSTIS